MPWHITCTGKYTNMTQFTSSVSSFLVFYSNLKEYTLFIYQILCFWLALEFQFYVICWSHHSQHQETARNIACYIDSNALLVLDCDTFLKKSTYFDHTQRSPTKSATGRHETSHPWLNCNRRAISRTLLVINKERTFWLKASVIIIAQSSKPPRVYMHVLF